MKIDLHIHSRCSDGRLTPNAIFKQAVKKGLLNEFEGDLELAIAAYNAGSKKVREFNGIPPYETTRNYVKKVFQYYRYYQNSKV